MATKDELKCLKEIVKKASPGEPITKETFNFDVVECEDH